MSAALALIHMIDALYASTWASVAYTVALDSGEWATIHGVCYLCVPEHNGSPPVSLVS